MSRALISIVVALTVWLDCAAADAKIDVTSVADDIVGLSDGQSNPAKAAEAAASTASTKPGRAPRPPRPVWARLLPSGFMCNTGSTTLVRNAFGRSNVAFVPCARGTSAPPPPTPLEAAYEAWYTEVVLPDPTLATNPTRAITGLDTYLTIGGAPTVTWSGTALGQAVRLEVSSVYDINWGDPRPDPSVPNGRAKITGTTARGGRYPNGNLRHQYIERGPVTITVTQRWTANWWAGGQSGTLTDQLSTSTTLVLPVEELQAVLKP